jgi:hypothetical protein
MPASASARGARSGLSVSCKALFLGRFTLPAYP